MLCLRSTCCKLKLIQIAGAYIGQEVWHYFEQLGTFYSM